MFISRDNLMISTLLMVLLIVCFASNEVDGRVIFYAPIRKQLVTGQILSSSAKEEPCEKCFMRDHRKRCRPMLHFNVGGVHC